MERDGSWLGLPAKGKLVMTAIDFSRSYMRWFNCENTNSVRILIDASCTPIDDETGQSDTYYLIALHDQACSWTGAFAKGDGVRYRCPGDRC